MDQGTALRRILPESYHSLVLNSFQVPGPSAVSSLLPRLAAALGNLRGTGRLVSEILRAECGSVRPETAELCDKVAAGPGYKCGGASEALKPSETLPPTAM